MSYDNTKEENRKYDQGKARFDLIPAAPLKALAEVYTMGAAKYAPRGWEAGIKWGRVFGAIMRHLWAYWMGEDKDPESGLSHLSHAAWGCFALMEYGRTHPELDDRPSKLTEQPTYERPAVETFSRGMTDWKAFEMAVPDNSNGNPYVIRESGSFIPASDLVPGMPGQVYQPPESVLHPKARRSESPLR